MGNLREIMRAMEQDEKILQISGSGDVLYALSSKSKLYVGTMHGKQGFEWRLLPEMNFEKMKRVSTLTANDDEGAQPVFTPPEDGAIKTASLLRDDVKPEEPKADEVT